MKFSTKFLSRQGRRVHPENVTSPPESKNKLRAVLHHLQVALEHLVHIGSTIEQKRALKKKENTDVTADLSVLEKQRNEYVMYVRQQSLSLRHLDSRVRRQEMAAKTRAVFTKGTG